MLLGCGWWDLFVRLGRAEVFLYGILWPANNVKRDERPRVTRPFTILRHPVVIICCDAKPFCIGLSLFVCSFVPITERRERNKRLNNNKFCARNNNPRS